MVASFSLLLLPPEDFLVAIAKVQKALKKGGVFLIFLNEALSRSSSMGAVQRIQGEQMFSRGITENEIITTLGNNKFVIDRLEREIVNTKEYGEEHTILCLAHKI